MEIFGTIIELLLRVATSGSDMQKQHQSASHAPKSKFNLITKFTRLRNANIHYNGEIFTRDSDATVYVESQLGDCMYMMVTDQVTMSVA